MSSIQSRYDSVMELLGEAAKKRGGTASRGTSGNLDPMLAGLIGSLGTTIIELSKLKAGLENLRGRLKQDLSGGEISDADMGTMTQAIKSMGTPLKSLAGKASDLSKRFDQAGKIVFGAVRSKWMNSPERQALAALAAKENK